MAEANHKKSGGCLCGAVRYDVTGPLRDVILCHCGQCRRQHGSFGAYSEAALADVDIRDGGGLAWFESSARARRGFCRHCGSGLFWQRPGGATTSIAAGSLDQPTGLAVVRHIYVADKADFYEIGDRLPQLPGSQIR